MYPSLQLYFTDVNSDLNESDDENNSIEILGVLNSFTTKPYFEFLSHALHCANEFKSESMLFLTPFKNILPQLKWFSKHRVLITGKFNEH